MLFVVMKNVKPQVWRIVIPLELITVRAFEESRRLMSISTFFEGKVDDFSVVDVNLPTAFSDESVLLTSVDFVASEVEFDLATFFCG
jgi:hypothetical protein